MKSIEILKENFHTYPGFPYDFHTEFKFCPDDLRAILLHRSQGSK